MSTSSSILQDIMGDVYSRRLLLIHSTTVYQPPSTAASPSSAAGTASGDNSFDANVIMVLSVLLCALICSLGLNSIIRCALRCSAMVSAAPGGGGAAASARLANTGVKRKALKAFTTVSYSPELSLPGLDAECAICLSEFAAGERVKLLPRCHHGFHARCVDKWLGSHSSCPTCRDCLIDTCHKIAAAAPCGDMAAVSTSDAHVVVIAPLEPEGLIRNYRVIS